MIKSISRPSAPSIPSDALGEIRSLPGHTWVHERQLFAYTRGRFLLDEAKQMACRRVQFSMDGLASVAASSVDAKHRVDIENCPEGLADTSRQTYTYYGQWKRKEKLSLKFQTSMPAYRIKPPPAKL
ncbi:hypothetical protein GX51_03547 [Blastomyces parvus]|uniref:Uncharacterized protein n=1 Tax=Blastomyces parvus TaxID=2060905 RepID=A0A2B7X6V8_9EURO|nr:hypothetical protein GX51_03547 [Blastomyces parvus]